MRDTVYHKPDNNWVKYSVPSIIGANKNLAAQH